jgi:uncharacterized membrane protein YhhN
MNRPAIRTPYRPNAGILPFSAGQSAVLAVSIIAGLAYPMLEGRFAAVPNIAAKGLGVAALALVAAMARHWWLAAIMAAGALGDVLLELPGGLVPGGAAFAAGHVLAIIFYSRTRRAGLSPGEIGIAGGLAAYGLVMPWLVMPAGSAIAAPTVYSALLCTMAATALLSRFRRDRLALGALLFVVSDTLLIMRLGGRLVGGETLHGLLVWYSYYLAQLGLFLGVAQGPTTR